MRLHKLTIGSDKEPINDIDNHRYKNLKNVTVDFAQGEWITVVIGKNGTGKSNVLEAITHIFCELVMDASMLSRKPDLKFYYKLTYSCNDKVITISGDPDKPENAIYEVKYIDLVDSNDKETQFSLIEDLDDAESNVADIKYSTFRKKENKFLPQFIFGYYSGNSDRMQSAFEPYLKRYDDALRNSKNGQEVGLRKLFYALPEHSQFVLLAFMETDQKNSDLVIKKFLETEIGIDPDDGFDSVLFVLKQPPWDRNPRLKLEAKKKKIDFEPDVFWGAEGTVRKFLDRLLDISLAPVRTTRDVKNTLWAKKGNETEFVYLFVKDIEALRKLRNSQTGREFFKELESTYVSELIDDVRIRVKLKKNDGTVTFKELSEGEQQLLTVLGLLRFTAERESIFLLDEPDTHLNPKWNVKYIDYLKEFVNSANSEDSSSHIILTTHNPIAVAELNREQVQILHHKGQSREIVSLPPEKDPKGMGYSGVITSDLFGLGSSLDRSTTKDLLKLHELSTKSGKLTEEEKNELRVIRERIEKLDFNFASDDRIEREFTRARFELSKSSDKAFDDPILTKENREKALGVLVQSLLESLNVADD
ncbi:AAA family ATPase [Vibrio lentus]|uniref:AAA family ATPase n=1 Tax=Vibrio lentus TaxID=136468 RepID=UPI000C86790E|nr:AAA family ATPase [Vibrio lentus]PMG76919.1 hypothetical protein BCU86_21870 [Vibrio lentus]